MVTTLTFYERKHIIYLVRQPARKVKASCPGENQILSKAAFPTRESGRLYLFFVFTTDTINAANAIITISASYVLISIPLSKVKTI